jgi:hypothetical protein
LIGREFGGAKIEALMAEGKQSCILAGSSHLLCFDVPLSTADGRAALTPLKHADKDFLCLNGPFPRGEAYWSELQRRAGDYKLFVMWRGNQHMAEHLFASSPPFDFVLSDEVDLPVANDSILVPEQMVREGFSPSFEKLQAMLKNILEAAHRGVVICGTPPPKADVAAIRAGLSRHDFFLERIAALGSTADAIAITAPLTLYKMWKLIQNMLRDIAKRYALQFVPVPAESQTPTGFLREEFWSLDATHANIEFGRLFLQRLREYV